MIDDVEKWNDIDELKKATEISARAFASRSYERERQELLKRRAAILKIKASL